MYRAETCSVEIETPTKILVVEDDPGDVKLVRLALLESASPYETESADCISTAIEYLHDAVFDVVLLDLGLPDSQGIDTVLKIQTQCPDIPIVVLTGLDDEETGIRAVRVGAQDYLIKGDVSCNLLTRTIRYAIERRRMENERRELERKVQMASRLATIGQLASGIGHEINNPLTGVVGYSQLLLMRKDIHQDIWKDVKIINEGAQRIANIIGKLLTFARYHKPRRTYLNINDIVANTLDILTHRLETDSIKVVTKLAPDLPFTIGDVGQLQQVFLNLIINAETEMKLAHGGGELSIKTEERDDSIRISFKDDGPGITRENLEQIFTPFFTTREVGEGMGLGLSVCHGIIAEHKGRIYAKSRAGKGTTFIVELPVVIEDEKIRLSESATEETEGNRCKGMNTE